MRTHGRIQKKFQSTLPLRGATIVCRPANLQQGISIHAPLTGSDQGYGVLCILPLLFQSTLPLRGATLSRGRRILFDGISIHAPLTGSDFLCFCHNFLTCEFQSTLPLRGATSTRAPKGQKRKISIHAPLTGSDGQGVAVPIGSAHFNPRSPYGERPQWLHLLQSKGGFQSKLPLRGATRYGLRHKAAILISIHAPLTGSDSVYLI